MDSENVAQRIFQVLQQNRQDLNETLTINGTYRDFTNRLKYLIAQLGENEFQCETASQSSSHRFSEGEWLFDLVWFKMSEEIGTHNYIKSIDLVLESEISAKKFKDFKVDFDKLFLVKKATRIMIFTKVNNSDLMSEIIDYGKNAVNSFTDFEKGDAIYLILFDEYYEGDFELIPLVKE